MSDDNNGSGAADTGQVSVAELLARNGAKVDTQSGGGRRRRGMAGGISVAELTGEIPIVRDETPAEAPDDETDASSETESPQDEPQQSGESARDAEPERPAPAQPAPHPAQPAPEPTRTTPRIDDRRRDQQARPTPAFGAARSARPEPALFSGAPSVAVDRLRASTEERALAPERPAPERPGTPEKGQSSAEPEVHADEITAENDAVTAIVPAVTEDSETPDGTDTADDADPATPTDAEPVEDAPVAPSKTRSPVKQWLSLIGQGIVAIVLGALLFKGFERLWEMLPWVALVLAFFVIVGLVAVVRVLRRTDDIVSILLAVVVGGFVTLGPLAFMLSTT